MTEKDEIELVGIPRSMVSAVCLDANENKSCDDGEALEFLRDTEAGRSVYDFQYDGAEIDPILVEITDPAKTNLFEKYTITFPADSDQLSMENYIDNPAVSLDNDQINQDFFFALQKNLNLLGSNGVELEDALILGKGKMAEDWIVTSAEGIEDEEVDLVEILSYSKEEAYQAAKENRGDEKALVNDQLVEKYECAVNELKTVKHFGVEDIFDLSNGIEPTYPSTNITTNPGVITYNNRVNAGIAPYDETSNDRFFADNINNLPSAITSARIFIGLKSNGSSLQFNDALYLGDYGNNHYGVKLQNLSANGGTWSHQLVNNSNPTTDVYWNDFRSINFNSPLPNTMTLLDYVQTNNAFDVLVQDDTSVDFITVTTCSKKDPVVEIKPILENFECKVSDGPDNETKVTLIGGTIDAFSNGADISATPSSALVNATSAYPTTEYDSTSYDKFLIDTLTLPASGYIANARLSLGVKALDSSLHSNDTLNIGYTHQSDRAGFKLYGNASNSVNTTWNVTPISNGERILQTDFNFNMNSGTNALTWLRGETELDITIQDDTTVDFVQLDLCMRDKNPCIDTDADGFCDDDEKEAGSDPDNASSTPDDIDGDGVSNDQDCDPNDASVSDDCSPKLPESCNTAINVDLRSASSWTNSTGTSPTENNVFDNTQWEDIVWDGAMNWFDFGNTPNAEHELKIDFCSCGGGDVKVTNMKSDNYSSVTLNNSTPAIVERTAYSQSTMANWGPDVSGTASIPFTGNGTDHSLIFKVKNQSGPSGGAIDGSLSFIGHLGACTDSDQLSVTSNTNRLTEVMIRR